MPTAKEAPKVAKAEKAEKAERAAKEAKAKRVKVWAMASALCAGFTWTTKLLIPIGDSARGITNSRRGMWNSLLPRPIKR